MGASSWRHELGLFANPSRAATPVLPTKRFCVCGEGFEPRSYNQWCCKESCRAKLSRMKKSQKKAPSLVRCAWRGCKSPPFTVPRAKGRAGQRFCGPPCRIAWHNGQRAKARKRRGWNWGVDRIAEDLGVDESQVRRWLGRD